MMKLAMSLICSVIIALLYSIFKGNITALLSVSDHCVNYSLSWCYFYSTQLAFQEFVFLDRIPITGGS